MAKKPTFSFLIDHIDPLGQGVFKKGDDIFFIPKTLPGESGVAEVLKSKKNIHFCKLLELENKSSQRIPSACPHFYNCPGCDFLHTDYQSETQFKLESFKRMLRNLPVEQIQTVKASKRLGYRNRIQLHYEKKTSKLGYVAGKEKRLLEVPDCKVFRPELQEDFDRLYKTKKTLLAKQKKTKGHVELYFSPDGNKSVAWNERYSKGGFSQVNREMNEKMLRTLEESIRDLPITSCLDLFAGDGNLTSALPKTTRRTHIDLYPEGDHGDFFDHDLFEEGSLEAFHSKVPKEEFDLFLVDPPRSGFKHLESWITRFKPKYLAYISCHPQTMVRDISALEKVEILECAMIDLFPSTRHFEAYTLLKLR